MSETRRLLTEITELYANRFEELQEAIRQSGITKEISGELKMITMHCLNVEKLMIEEAAKLGSLIPEIRKKLLEGKINE